jgi:DNA-binding NarL/FixJ family response regulator
MRNNSVIIATGADFLADTLKDILRDLDTGIVFVVRDEDELLARIKNSYPRCVFLENCFREQATEEYVQRLTRRYRDLRIAVWSASTVRPVIAARYIFAGAESYFSLRDTDKDIGDVLGYILRGRHYCPGTVREILDKGSYVPRIGKGLTAREVEIAKLSVSGQSNREIADVLGIRLPTVKQHKANIYRKCGGNSPVDILRYGLTRGIICPEDLAEF